MARDRGNSILWDANATVDVDTAPHATSPSGYVGAASNVAILVKVNKNCTFKIQVASNRKPGAGNNLDNADWYDYHRGADADGAETIVATSATPIAVDLSPFAPQFVRLVATAVATGPATVTALVTTSG